MKFILLVLFSFSTLAALEGEPQLIGKGNATSEFSLAENFAVWSFTDPYKSVIMASEYDENSETWLSPTLISNPNVHAEHPHVAVSSNGAAIIVWEATSLGNHVIQAAIRPEPCDPWL